MDGKYTRVEYERRFLVASSANWMTLIEPYSKTIEDKYLSNSRLRLRRITNSDGQPTTLKLNKKFDSNSPYFRTIGRMSLSPDEYELLAVLDGKTLKKVRYYHRYSGRIFAIDVFEDALGGLVLCEIETDSLEALMSVALPSYIQREVTENAFFEGGNLCRLTREEFLRTLSP